jgi:hypothetical protein
LFFWKGPSNPRPPIDFQRAAEPSVRHCFSNFTPGRYARLGNNYWMCHREVKTIRCVHGSPPVRFFRWHVGPFLYPFRRCSFVTLGQSNV